MSKKIFSILRFWPEKLNCGYSLALALMKKTTITTWSILAETPSPTMFIKNILYREWGKMTLVPYLHSNFHLISIIILSNVVISRLFPQNKFRTCLGSIWFILLFCLIIEAWLAWHDQKIAGLVALPKFRGLDCLSNNYYLLRRNTTLSRSKAVVTLFI